MRGQGLHGARNTQSALQLLEIVEGIKLLLAKDQCRQGPLAVAPSLMGHDEIPDALGSHLQQLLENRVHGGTSTELLDGLFNRVLEHEMSAVTSRLQPSTRGAGLSGFDWLSRLAPTSVRSYRGHRLLTVLGAWQPSSGCFPLSAVPTSVAWRFRPLLLW